MELDVDDFMAFLANVTNFLFFVFCIGVLYYWSCYSNSTDSNTSDLMIKEHSNPSSSPNRRGNLVRREEKYLAIMFFNFGGIYFGSDPHPLPGVDKDKEKMKILMNGYKSVGCCNGNIAFYFIK